MILNPDELFPAPIKKQGSGRVVRPMGPDEEDEDDLPKGMRRLPSQLRLRPFLVSDAMGDTIMTKEPAVPKGIYDRKARAAKAANDAAPEPKKRGRKRRAVAVVPEVAAVPLNGSKGRFDVALDLRAGAVTINATAGSLTLAPDEVLALFAFLGRR